ncbi:MAG: PEP-CTERM sorting domain-containing protein [Sedimentisphaerales bacterium]|nr:PEP-CTERM sorting domain-containing protein [Sedimentisphaerales bacterium]
MRNLMMGGVGVIMLALAVGASGDTVELPLNCAGFYDVNTPAWTYDFDLGVTFSEITNVYIDWSGEINGALVGSFYNPGNTYPLDIGIKAYLDLWGSIEVYGGEETYPAPEPFAQTSTFRISQTSISELYDGKGTIMIYSTYPRLTDDIYIEYGSIMLNNATLIVEGTIIPEPSTLVLIGLGFIQVIRRRRHRD